ncbi:NAD(P)/FAD-dependent oxidoreductase [Polyangium mundeleinium]|uniref:NAD(P)/FAD-dependent oxidoreductase n=1 Tax=Polyangium mundeleinium TaxID=2995306 RepID=A0ABT5F335_9BACT|nr:NAD(P)/FAD-dependent oxidoreductase [Polyangium mundeleinium]MDC0748029.1 NAD(P)/FAD-dependent oxidoreductase [Polyangium mundeleinium]
MIEADVVVIGAGPAGSASAIALAGAGLRVAVFGRAQARERIGESLSPGAPSLLAQLGVWERFRADGHLPCHANASAWGSAALAWHDFLRDPRGHGFHIDRARFEAMLRERAIEVGARLFEEDAPRGWQLEGGVWRAAANADSRVVAARYVVDASGRAASFARSQGATRLVAWEQVALVAFARAARPIEETFTLIEAVREGFWYSAPIPGGRFALALFTDAALHHAPSARTPEGLGALLDASTHTRHRLEGHRARLEGAPRFVDAGSARLAHPQGPGWVAVGDAALCYDPISAHGLTLALRTGVDAAAALVADWRGDASALPAYATRLTRAFDDYRREALHIYRSEQRWLDAPYWHARHAR